MNSIKKLKNFLTTRKYLIAELLIFILVAVSYTLINWKFDGPTYLADEIGYLGKAAFLAGQNADLSSSYHVGYSIFLAPIFIIFKDPFIAWKGLLILNGILWGGTFVLLFKTLRILFNKLTIWQILLPVVFCSFYPSYVVMSGYAFATTAFVFVLMVGVYALAKSKLTSRKYLLIYAASIGLLYWIHPTALPIIFVSSLVFIAKGVIENKIKEYLFIILIPVILVLLYAFTLDPMLAKLMTPQGFDHFSHYSTERIANADYLSLRYWTRFIAFVAGMLSYALIATFGIVSYAVIRLFSDLFNRNIKKSVKSTLNNPITLIILIITLSVIGVAVMSSLGPASLFKKVRPDIWTYGRYIDHFILPLMAIGFLQVWKLSSAMLTSLYIMLVGIILRLIVDSNNTNFAANNIINLQSYWISNVVQDGSFTRMYLTAAAFILAAWALSQHRKYLILLLIPIYISSINTQLNWHTNVYNGYSKQTGVYEYISSLPNVDCIGLNYPDNESNTQIKTERMRLYSYLLYDYEPKRMDVETWAEQCKGIYIAYPNEMATYNELLKPIAIEGFTELTVYELRVDKDGNSPLTF